MRGLNVRNLLIVGETAMALVLLVAAGLMLQSVNNLQRTALGFQPDGLVTFPLSLPRTQYRRAHSTRFFLDLLDRVPRSPAFKQQRSACARPFLAAATARAPRSRASRPWRLGRTELGIHWASPAFSRR